MIIKPPGGEEIPALRALWKEAFEDTDVFLDSFFESAFCADRCRCVTVDHTLAAALYWFDCEYRDEKVAYLYAIATLKSYRGRGLCRKLMDEAHSILKKAGYVCVILVPGEKSLFDFYGKMGYRVFSLVDEKHIAASYQKIELKRIDSLEYGRIRRGLLPENSVIQEKECLDYLGAYAELYKGEGILCACVRNGDSVRITELLGNTSYGGGIVHALGCKTGLVRAAGDSREFSMYLPLCEKKIDTFAYFGLAFD